MYTLTTPQPNESLPEYVKRIRGLLGMSQKELATQAGIHLQSLGKVERGQTTRLNQKTISGLAYALQVPAEYLEAVIKKVPVSVASSVKFCPSCWRPGTAPDPNWANARAKFCLICGTPLRHRCPGCDEPVVSLKFRFCPYCGCPYKETVNGSSARSQIPSQ